jgi:hypothetical protein
MSRLYPQRILGHWDRFIDGLRLSTLEFYSAVEGAIAERGITNVVVARVAWPERGIFSPRRYYLQVSFDDLLFIISAVPSGHATYVSWWCGLSERGFAAWLSNLNLLGWLFRPVLRPMTFYRIDTMRAFEHGLHNALLQVIDTQTKAKGVRRLSEAARKPVMHDFAGAP